jgi:hypothetical protein
MKIGYRAPLIAAFVLASMEPVALAEGRARPRSRIRTLSGLRQTATRPQGREVDRKKFLRRILPRLGSEVVVRKVARHLGLSEWRGKRLDRDPKVYASDTQALMALDQPVASFDLSENQPTIAVDPTDESAVVVFAQNSDFSGTIVACSIYLSFDGGVSFTHAADVPLVNVDDTCAEPVVRFSPDGSVVYYNYLSVQTDGSSDVVVTVADGNEPASFLSGPTIVLPGGANIFDANWLGVHTFDSAEGVTDGSSYVYVTATLFYASGGCEGLLNRSSDYGVTWDFGSGVGFVAASDCNINFHHGARIDGGPGRQVLICFYDSMGDGVAYDRPPPALSNRFNVNCVSSADRLDTIDGIFEPHLQAANNVGFELNYYLGPNELYHVWWQGMFPSVAIDHQGNAHVVFTMDPTASKVDAESGNVQYVRSFGGALDPPYPTWTGRVTLGTGPRAQGFPNVVAQRSNSTSKPYIYVAYYDHYRSPKAAPNLLYDVRYRRSINGGATFTAPVLVTEVPSLSDDGFIGHYFGTTASMRRFHVAWTDRADKTDILDPEDDVFADRY